MYVCMYLYRETQRETETETEIILNFYKIIRSNNYDLSPTCTERNVEVTTPSFRDIMLVIDRGDFSLFCYD